MIKKQLESTESPTLTLMLSNLKEEKIKSCKTNSKRYVQLEELFYVEEN